MSLNINEIDRNVSKFLKDIGVKAKAQFIGAVPTGSSPDWEQAYDLFNITLTNRNAVFESFQFRTGTGHRILPKKRFTYDYMRFDTNTGKALKEIRGFYNMANNEKVAFNLGEHRLKMPFSNQVKDTEVYAVLPTPANVLYCLVSDMCAEEENFKWWCESLGYDSDSISALNTYNACIKIAEQMRRVFTSEQLDQLRELLEDY